MRLQENWARKRRGRGSACCIITLAKEGVVVLERVWYSETGGR